MRTQGHNTILDELADKDGDLDHGEEVNDPWDLLAVARHHAQLPQADARLARLCAFRRLVDMVLYLGVLVGRVATLALGLERDVICVMVVSHVFRGNPCETVVV